LRMRMLPLPDRMYSHELVIEENYRKVYEEVTTYDILYFIECLGKDRGTHYLDYGRPDVNNRNDPRPDRLVVDEKTGRQLAIEHADLHESQEYMKQLDYEIKKNGFSSGTLLNACELAERLAKLIEKKKLKNQFINYPNAEKVFLFRDRCTSGKTKDLLECDKYLVLPNDLGCDHCFILQSTGVLLEVF
jgi:hypothetical protein